MPAWLLPLLAGSAVGAGAGLGLSNKPKQATSQFFQYPEYPEAEGARSKLWETLQKWGALPGYGAIQPNWADIWTRTQRRVSDYFGGTPTQPGARDRVRASAARRGVSDSPSIDANIAALGVEEGRQLQDLSTEQGLQEANLSESGRKYWLDNIVGLSQQHPQGSFYQQQPLPSFSERLGNVLSGIGGAGLQYYGAQQQQNWLTNLSKGQSGPGGTGGIVGDPFQNINKNKFGSSILAYGGN